MAKLIGPALGTLDPIVLTLREAYVAYRDRHNAHWHTEANAARWAEERTQWLAGETMIATTEDVFMAAMEAGLDHRPFTFAHDPDESRMWQLPGVEGGPLVEVAVVDGVLVVIGAPDDPNSVRQTRSEIARSGGNTRWRNAHA